MAFPRSYKRAKASFLKRPSKSGFAKFKYYFKHHSLRHKRFVRGH